MEANIPYMFPSFLGTNQGTNFAPNLGIHQTWWQIWPQIWGQILWFPILGEEFSPKYILKFVESQKLPLNFGMNSSSNNPTISGANCPQLQRQVRHQIWCTLKFRDKFVPKFGESPNLGMNSSLTMSQKADEHSSNIHDVWTTHTWAYLIFVIFLHGQNFWRIEFTPKNANFSR